MLMRSTAGFEHEMLKRSPISLMRGRQTSERTRAITRAAASREKTSGFEHPSLWVRSHLHIHALVIRPHEQYSPYE